MYTSQGKRRDLQDLKSYRTFFAVTTLVAMAVVFFGLQIMMVGPLKGELQVIQGRLLDTEDTMQKLVAERNQLWRTNDLLSSLQQQAQSVDSIRETLASIQGLREEVELEAAKTQQALAAFNSMAELQTQLAAQAKQTEIALAQLNGMATLQKTVIASAQDTEPAFTALDNLSGVTAAAIAGSSQVDEAEASVARLSELKYRMLGESDGLTAAEKNLDRVTALNKKLDADSITAAEENANRLLVINDSLASVDTDAAGAGLDSLIDLESRLVAKADIASAIHTLEILDDFQAEVDNHIRSIEGIRRTMVEIAMLESSVGRAARVLEPLVQLSSLRRLGEREVREAARVILDQRSTTRLSQNSSIVNTADSGDTNIERQDDLVPLPINDEEATNE